MTDPQQAQLLHQLQRQISQQADLIDRLHQQLADEQARNQELKAWLAAESERAEIAFELMQEYAFSYRVNPDYSLTREWCTSSFQRISGYSAADIDADGWELFIHPDDLSRARDYMRQVIAGQPGAVELRIITAAGDTRWTRNFFRPYWDEQQQRVTYIYGAGKDITEERAIQDQQARFITNAMHEFSHPVSSILMRLYLMRKQPELLEKHLNALEPVANHLRRMVEDMREISYLERGLITLDRQPLPLQQLLSQAVRSVHEEAKRRQVRLLLRLHETPLVVMADPERLRRAFVDLLDKAVKLAVEATVGIELSPQPPDAPLSAVVRIIYRGTPGAADHPSVIFSPFHRPSEGSVHHTGMELSIVREVIRLHGGEINALVDGDGSYEFVIALLLTDDR